MSEPTGFRHFLAELKRRKVFRVTAVYGAASFGILQAADILFPRIGLPDWTVTLVAALALAGFPLALILSWAFERTPEGVHKTSPAVTGELEAIASAPAKSRWPLGIAALGGIALLGFGAWWVLGRPDAAEARSYDSIAVLPFVNMTEDPQNEYLGDGLAEELLNALTRIEGLRVESRTSSFALKDSRLGATAIGDSLGVATVLEGSVRRSPDRLRVTAQLIDTADGSHVWSETYDRAPADLLDIQDDLSHRIVEALAVALAPDSVTRVMEPGTRSAVAYDYFLQGRFFWNKRTPEDLDVAVGLFHKAIAEDSTFAAAYAGIADSRAVPAGWDEDPAPALDTAEAYALRALEIDPTLSQAHASLGLTRMMRDLDFARAEESFRRAIELDPTYATAHQWYAELLSALDRHDEAVGEGRRAVELDPTMIIRWNLSRTLYNAERYEEAIEVSEALMADGRTSFGPAPMYWLLSLAMLGRYEEAIELGADTGIPPGVAEMARDSLEVLGASEFPAFLARRLAEGLAAAEPNPESSDVGSGRGLLILATAWARVDRNRALDYLERIGHDGNSVASRVEWFEVLLDPVFDDLRDDPRYRTLMQRFGLAF
jgi:TolB-like protein